MTGERKLNITFEPEFANVDKARVSIQKTLEAIYKGPESASGITDFCIAVVEAMNNAVEHSDAKTIDVEITAGDTETEFRLITKGKRFDPTIGIEMPDLDISDDLPEGGFGLALIKELVDSLTYEYESGKNILILKKRIKEV